MGNSFQATLSLCGGVAHGAGVSGCCRNQVAVRQTAPKDIVFNFFLTLFKPFYSCLMYRGRENKKGVQQPPESSRMPFEL